MQSFIIPPVIGLLVAMFLKVRPKMFSMTADVLTAQLAAYCIVIAGAVCWIASFLFNYMWSSLASIHAEQALKIHELTAIPKIDPHEQAQRQYVSEQMAAWPPEERNAINAIIRRGKIHRRDAGKMGFSPDLVFTSANRAISAGVLCESEDRHAGGNEQYL